METPANFHRLLRQTGTHGRMRIAMRGGECVYVCSDCPATFAQSDAGWKAKNEHEMEHGRPTTYEASELDGKALRIFVVETESEYKYLDNGKPRCDIYGQSEDGFVYHLASEGSWKWKRVPSPLMSLPTAMPEGQESPSNGSGNMVER